MRRLIGLWFGRRATPRPYAARLPASIVKQLYKATQPPANGGVPASDPRLVKWWRVSQAASSYATGAGSEAFAVVDDASAGKDVVATKKPEAEDGAVAKPGEEEDEQEGNGMMREIYKHLLPVLAVVIVVAQLRKIYLTPAHHVGAVW
jgi:hypothetical protein